jgi:hypothetical protein
MFEQLFKCPHALARHRHGPLVEERCRYLTHCAGRQISPRTLRDIAIYTLAVAGALRLVDIGPTNSSRGPRSGPRRIFGPIGSPGRR